MIAAFSTPQNRIQSLVLLVAGGLSAAASAAAGIDDNLPGVLLALLAAIAFVLAFAHPWRTARKFLFLLLAAVLGFVLFMAWSIITDSILQNPSTSAAVRNRFENPVNDILSLILSMIFTAAFLIGAVGAVSMAIRSRRDAGRAPADGSGSE